MAQTSTELYNLAAQALQARGRLVTTNTNNRFVEVFDLWLPFVQPIVLASAAWPSCTKTAYLSLNKTRTSATWEATDPKPGYKYSYTAPPDMIHPQYISTYGHFAMGMLGDTRCIFAHEESAILTYTFNQTNLGKWEPQLFLCVALALAAFTAKTLTGKPQLSQLVERDANNLIIQQRELAAEHQEEPTESVASWHLARGYLGPAEPARFVYPAGPLIAVGQSANVK